LVDGSGTTTSLADLPDEERTDLPDGVFDTLGEMVDLRRGMVRDFCHCEHADPETLGYRQCVAAGYAALSVTPEVVACLRRDPDLAPEAPGFAQSPFFYDYGAIPAARGTCVRETNCGLDADINSCSTRRSSSICAQSGNMVCGDWPIDRWPAQNFADCGFSLTWAFTTW
jgi:hypothetical protein